MDYCRFHTIQQRAQKRKRWFRHTGDVFGSKGAQTGKSGSFQGCVGLHTSFRKLLIVVHELHASVHPGTRAWPQILTVWLAAVYIHMYARPGHTIDHSEGLCQR
jgi:hypothetical protein